MATTSPVIPVIIIQSLQSDLCAMETIPGLSIRIIDKLSPETLLDIIHDPMTKNAFIILEKEAFKGYESPMRSFIKKIRGRHGRNPRILVLRSKILGRENPDLTAGDMKVGANAVLWYQLSMSTEDLTTTIHRFILNPSIDFSQPIVSPDSSEPILKTSALPVKKVTPKKREAIKKPFVIPKRASLPIPRRISLPVSARERSVATLKKMPKRRAEVTFYGVTIEFRLSVAETLLSLANAPAEISQRELMQKLKIARQPVYDRVKRLRASLEAYAPGLGACIIRTEKESERHLPLPWYRFDHDIWCKVLGIK